MIVSQRDESGHCFVGRWVCRENVWSLEILTCNDYSSQRGIRMINHDKIFISYVEMYR